MTATTGKSWKQPIPSNLEEVFGDDYLSRLIYQELLLKATNKERQVNLNGFILTLNRGQAYFTERYLSKILNRHRDTIRNSLERCQKLYHRLTITKTTKGSIATILNYEEIVGMNHEVYHSPTTDRPQPATNKSDKSVYKQLHAASKTLKPENSNEELWLEAGVILQNRLQSGEKIRSPQKIQELIYQDLLKVKESAVIQKKKDDEVYKPF